MRLKPEDALKGIILRVCVCLSLCVWPLKCMSTVKLIKFNVVIVGCVVEVCLRLNAVVSR